MNDIPSYKSYNGETRIALLDNSAVAFMHHLSHFGFKPEVLFKDYDLILIPAWVWIEIKDSDFRRGYIESLVVEGFPIRKIEEIQYTDLLNQEEITLYHIISAAVSSLAQLMQYLRKNVAKPDLLDLEFSKEWIPAMYENWPISGKATDSGRTIKKNAGEISLTILAEIFSWYYPNIEALTIYSQDKDMYDFQTRAEQKLKKVFGSDNPISVTYKSNDFILWQLYQQGTLRADDILQLRKDARTVTYTQRRPDQSVELVKKVLDNEAFLKIITDRDVQIIF